MKKGAVSIITIMSMLFAMLLPINAFADDIPVADVTYDSEHMWSSTLVIDENKTVKFSDVNFTDGAEGAPPVRVVSGVTANLVFDGENSFSGNAASAFAGIEVQNGATVNIYGTEGSSLTVRGGNGCPGIGSAGYEKPLQTNLPGGNINIRSGNITAIGGNKGAGIGSGNASSAGEINIYGGTVYAYGVGGGAGIGSGYGTSGGSAGAKCGYYSGGSITILGGDVSAAAFETDFNSLDIDSLDAVNESTMAAGIGGGYGASSGNIVIGGDATVAAVGCCGGAGIGTGRGPSTFSNYDGNAFCNITIKDSASVYAFATNDNRDSQKASDGGAAIGTGRHMGSPELAGSSIVIKDNVYIFALGAANANAIGTGVSVGKYSTDAEGNTVPPAPAELDVSVSGNSRVIAISDGKRSAVYENAEYEGVFSTNLDFKPICNNPDAIPEDCKDGRIIFNAYDNNTGSLISPYMPIPFKADIPSNASILLPQGEEFKIRFSDGNYYLFNSESNLLFNSGISYDITALHKHNYERSYVAPTCTEKGSGTYTCDGCGDSYVYAETDKLGHDFSNNAEYCRHNCNTKNPNYVPPVTPVVPDKPVTPVTPVKPVTKKKNPITVKPIKITLKYNKLKKKALSIKRSKALTVKKAKGNVTYKLTSAKKGKKSYKKYFKVSASGKITVKKGLRKGTYKVKIKVKAAGNSTYKSKTKTVTVKIKVK